MFSLTQSYQRYKSQLCLWSLGNTTTEMGNQNGKTADRSIDEVVARSPARTKLNENEVHFTGEKEGTSIAVQEPRETDEPIDKYQVAETTKEVTLEVSTMATEVGSSISLPVTEEDEGKEKSSFVDIAEVNEATKDGAKSPLVLKSEERHETVDLKNEPAETATPHEKPSDVSAGEKELLLARVPVSGELSESGISTSPNKMKRLSQSSSFFKSCLFCIPTPTS